MGSFFREKRARGLVYSPTRRMAWKAAEPARRRVDQPSSACSTVACSHCSRMTLCSMCESVSRSRASPIPRRSSGFAAAAKASSSARVIRAVALTHAGNGLRPRVLDLIEPQLRAVGIELLREFWPANVIFSQVLPAGRFEVAIMSWSNSGPSYLGKEVYGSGGELNWTGYNQRLVTADLDQARRILNGEQQARVVNRADRQLA